MNEIKTNRPRRGLRSLLPQAFLKNELPELYARRAQTDARRESIAAYRMSNRPLL